MPVVQMPDGTLVDMPDNPTPQQKAALRAKVDPGFLRTLGSTAMERVVKPVGAAASDLLRLPDYKTMFTGTPEEKTALLQQRIEDVSLSGQPRELLRTGLDVAGIAAPVAAPWATAAGVGAETAARMAGASPETASGIGTAAELLQPLGKLGLAGSKRVLAARSRQLVSQAEKGFLKESKGVSKVFDDTEKLAGNLTLDASHPSYNKLSDSITEAKQLLGPNLVGRNMKIVSELESELASGKPISYSRLEDFHRFLRENLPEPGKVTFSDKQLAHSLQSVRSNLRGAQIATVQGSPLEEPLTSAIGKWRKEIVPTRKTVARFETQTPASVAKRAALDVERGRGIPEVNRTMGQIAKTEALRQPGAGGITGAARTVAPPLLGAGVGVGGQVARGRTSPEDLILGGLSGAALGAGPLPSMVRGAQTPAGAEAILQFLTLAGNRARPLVLSPEAIEGIGQPPR